MRLVFSSVHLDFGPFLWTSHYSVGGYDVSEETVA